MAEGLRRMLDHIGVKSTLFYNGWDIIRDRTSFGERKASRVIRDAALDWRLKWHVREWLKYDALIIVGHNPAAFMRGFWNDAKLRGMMKQRPIILYDLVYLGTRGEWAR